MMCSQRVAYYEGLFALIAHICHLRMVLLVIVDVTGLHHMCDLNNMCGLHKMCDLHKGRSPIKDDIRIPYQLSTADACQPPNYEIIFEVLIRALVFRLSTFVKLFF